MTSEPKTSKKLFFLVAMPRSGNTLFTSIMNQNTEIAVTPNSITLEIMKDLFLLKDTDVFQNYPDHKSLDNVLDSVYDIYYKDWPQRIIIDRGPVMTSGNFLLMQKHFKRPFKCIILLRDLIDVLASYMKWYTENPNSFVNRYNCKNDEEKLGMIMKNKAETLTSGSSQPEVFNVLGQLKSIERVKKSGEMIYNKKEQLTSDLGAKEK